MNLKKLGKILTFSTISASSLFISGAVVNVAQAAVSANESGSVMPKPYFAINSHSVDGTFTKNVDRVELKLKNRIIGNAKTIHTAGLNIGTFTIPVEDGLLISNADRVNILAYNDKNQLVDTKPVSIIADSTQSISVSPYSLSSGHSITGQYHGDVKKLVLKVNGKKIGMVDTNGVTSFNLPVDKGIITERSDRVEIIALNKQGRKIVSGKVTVFP